MEMRAFIYFYIDCLCFRRCGVGGGEVWVGRERRDYGRRDEQNKALRIFFLFFFYEIY